MTNIGVSVPEEDLAVRCEQATGPNRELDARIWCLLQGYRFIKMAKHGDTWGDIEGTDRGNTLMAGWMVFEHPNPGRLTGGQFQQYSCEHGDNYTASLDAAMTLVPGGGGICLNMGEGPWVGHFARIWNVSAELACEGKDACEWEVHGVSSDSLALALCAAALRARVQGHSS